MPEPSKNQLIQARKRELIAKGFRPGIVSKAMDWAVGSAEGMASYTMKIDASDGRFEGLTLDFLPRYLQDAEKWIKAFVGEPEEQ
ncbi:hypothetical protein LCGC14_1284730 [marine sediment metagenome]|uniref:Uncharacterized protein n=1 Tax=marine sediment metagenome TaxID=412755 RepID=A0A0F9KVX3_9ZZZZ